MSNTDDDFSYDTTASAGAATTLQDPPQGGSGSGGGDNYDSLDGVDADLKDFEGTSLKCVGFCSKPRVTKPNDRGEQYVWITFTACEPPGVAGRTDDLGGPVKGGDSGKRKRTLDNLNKLCKAVHAKWDSSSLVNTLRGLEQALANAGSTVKYTLNKGNQGGVFVNP